MTQRWSLARVAVLALAAFGCQLAQPPVVPQAAGPLSSPLGGSRYDRHPDAPLFLGIGFSPRTPLEPKVDCLKFKESEDNSVVSQHLSLTLVRTKLDVARAERVDVRIAAGVLGIGGLSSSFASKIEESRQKAAITLVLRADGVYQTKTAVDWELKDSAKAVLSGPDSGRAFIDKCGSRVPLRAYRGSQVALIFSISQASDTEQRALDATFDANVDAAVVSASAKAVFNSTIQRAASDGTLSFDSAAVGADTTATMMSTVRAFLLDPAKVDFEKISQALLADLSPTKQTALFFDTVSMKRVVAGLSTVPIPDEDVDSRLVAIADQILTLDESVGEARSVSGHLVDADVTRNAKTSLKTYLEATEQRLRDLRARYAECLAGGPCEVPPQPESRVPLRAVTRSVTEQFHLSADGQYFAPFPVPYLRVRSGDLLAVKVETLVEQHPHDVPMPGRPDCTAVNSVIDFRPMRVLLPGGLEANLGPFVKALVLEFLRVDSPTATQRVRCEATKLGPESVGSTLIFKLDNKCGQFDDVHPTFATVRPTMVGPPLKYRNGFTCASGPDAKIPFEKTGAEVSIRPAIAFRGSMTVVGEEAGQVIGETTTD